MLLVYFISCFVSIFFFILFNSTVPFGIHKMPANKKCFHVTANASNILITDKSILLRYYKIFTPPNIKSKEWGDIRKIPKSVILTYTTKTVTETCYYVCTQRETL